MKNLSKSKIFEFCLIFEKKGERYKIWNVIYKRRPQLGI